jgi:alkylated DNA repair dioxygenase AlkB
MSTLVIEQAQAPGVLPEAQLAPAMDREALARSVAEAFEKAFAKLAEHKANIERLWEEFDALTGEDTIMGCRAKTEFCEQVLHRSIRTVRYMLAGGNPDNKKRGGEIISPETTVPRVSGAKLTAHDYRRARHVAGLAGELVGARKANADLNPIIDEMERIANDSEPVFGQGDPCLSKDVELFAETLNLLNASLEHLPTELQDWAGMLMGKIKSRQVPAVVEALAGPERTSTPAIELPPYEENFFSEEKADEYFQKLRDGLTWDHSPQYDTGARVVTMAYKGLYVGAGYRFNPKKIDNPAPIDWTPELPEMRSAVEAYLGLSSGTFNTAALNHYLGPEDYVGSHNDKDEESDWNFPIASVSLGSSRRFRLWGLRGNPSGRNYKDRGIAPVTMILRHGSLIVMPAGFQQKYKHEILKGLKPDPEQNEQNRWRGARINVTFRHVDESKPAHDLVMTPALEIAPTRREQAHVREAGTGR